MIPYTGNYFYPPRTESRIPFTKSPVLDMWRNFPDAVAQFKLNGNRNIIKVTPNGEIEFWNRHKETQDYNINELPAPIREAILTASPKGHWTVWDSELLHTKTKNVKHLVYIFDCLVWESKHLIGYRYKDRYTICNEAFSGRVIDMAKPISNVYLAQNILPKDWDSAWAYAKTIDFCEGFVLKRTASSSMLTYGDRPVNNSGFMCRCRKVTKNSTF